ncbi:MAG TPA: hypothetical protein VIN04_02215 [Myxococcota bacterium]
MRPPPLPRPPIAIDRVVEDPARIRRLVEARAPYWPVQRYFGNDAEYAALSGARGAAPMIVAPVFRGNWAFDGVCADPELAPLFAHPPFVEAARRLFGGTIVRPQKLFVNLTWQLPFPQGAGHTDIPAFRGMDRTRYPIAWLAVMGLSGLFEDVRLCIATAVAWFYEGEDGGFEYWPDGPDRPSRIHEGRIENTALVGDNDFMWHRVRPTGRPRDGMAKLGLDSELVYAGGAWAVRDGDRTLGRFGWDALRVSLSWKALVFESEADLRRYEDHTDDIDLAEVLRRYEADLAARGISVSWPDDPVHDPDVMRLLTETYVRFPVETRAA